MIFTQKGQVCGVLSKFTRGDPTVLDKIELGTLGGGCRRRGAHHGGGGACKLDTCARLEPQALGG